MTAVLFPDAEAVVVAALADVLDVPVGTMVPNPRPSSFVVVLRTGGPRRTKVSDGATLAVECWAATPAAAADLAAEVRAQVDALRGTVVDGVTVCRVAEAAGPQHLPDPESGQPRYTFAAEVDLRGQPLDGS